jgi:hypothetical protein
MSHTKKPSGRRIGSSADMLASISESVTAVGDTHLGAQVVLDSAPLNRAKAAMVGDPIDDGDHEKRRSKV